MRNLILIVTFYLTGCAQNASQKVDIAFIEVKPGSFIYGRFQPPFPTYDSSRAGYSKKDYELAEKLAKNDAMPGFEVNIPEPFLLGKYEITQSQWEEVMKTNPSFFKGDSLPVTNITWNDAQAFVDKLSEGDADYSYRLPTEFEWEYAARAGAQDDIAWDDIRQQAHISSTAPAAVGTKQPNAWGFYDMLGNVWEWTGDLYNEKIFADENPARTGSEHVLKGSSFVGDVKNATYMTHAGGPANGWDVGFRIVKERSKNKRKINDVGATDSLSRDSAFGGWHISRTTHQGTTPHVSVTDGEIVLKQHPFGQGGVLLTNKKYRDVEFSIEVKIDSFCNSGILLRSTESGQAYQIELSEPGGTGSLFGEMMQTGEPVTADKKQKVWKPGDWNHFRVKMTGTVPRIVLWINGELMWDVTQPKNDFTAGAGEGMIGLQSHWTATYSAAAKAFDMWGSWKPGAEIKFRNFSVREL